VLAWRASCCGTCTRKSQAVSNSSRAGTASLCKRGEVDLTAFNRAERDETEQGDWDKRPG
jgi:hypothetical protein